jgi:hypothetical protein
VARKNELLEKYTPHLLALGGLGLIWMITKPKSEDVIEKVMDASAVYEGETVSADSYRRIAAQRDGMRYVPCDGPLGGRITFTVPSTGVFTRNVIVKDGIVWAEISLAT